LRKQFACNWLKLFVFLYCQQKQFLQGLIELGRARFFLQRVKNFLFEPRAYLKKIKLLDKVEQHLLKKDFGQSTSLKKITKISESCPGFVIK